MHVSCVHMVRSQTMDVESSQMRGGKDQGNSSLRIQSIHKGYMKMTTETAKLSWRLLGSLSTESSSPFSCVHMCLFTLWHLYSSLRSTIACLPLT